MLKKLFLIIIIFFIGGINSWANGPQKIRLLYFNRPPYYVPTTPIPSGIIMDRVVEIFARCGIDVEYVLSTPNRIIISFKRGDKSICSPGWFKNTEREKIAKFSLPIYQNLPSVILTTKDREKEFKNIDTIIDLFKHKNLIWGKISSFSYGKVLDCFFKKIKPNTMEINGSQLDLIRMLRFHRFSYIIIAPEEIGHLVESAGYRRRDFVAIHLKDIPYGNKRYLMFSKDIPDKLINRINKIIKKYFKE